MTSEHMSSKWYKVLIIGESGVGKSTIVRQYCKGDIELDYKSTLGMDLMVKEIQAGTEKVCLQLWDCGGQDRFRGLVSSYYRNCNGLILTFDLENRNSFDKIGIWFEEAKEKTTTKKPVIFLVGNKKDLKKNSTIERYEVDELCVRLGIVKYFECTAFDNNNVNSVFDKMVEEMIRYDKNTTQETSLHSATLRLNNLKGSKGCCN
ncbi:GTP-binding protein YPT1, putative [Entamoeba invadens IP1]|uniref:GTP-binding protein YPT1, putative n=1 Tax=Entamoeba invadens IP1 TaxID=370355 RepID=A0A0A1U452_ENTIV|nr:GTP-binding protein YPT1, putative [Entamoeba invadens IP1]ELP86466.1 GTP-binding protein YPT1, putative [Entamoeba invadens IP1]|eukprot:XP_004185812.1 GTP-binding protein YPT1, putative [Entamoeba invadens IP1]